MKVAFIMGSDSDYPVIQKGIDIMEMFGIKYDVRVISAHRTPALAAEYAKNAEKEGIEVIIAAAGMAAHLAGAIAAQTCLPVIGIPVNNGALRGEDALLSTVMMPPGVPVACVGIDAGTNAGLLAVQMLSIKYVELRTRLSVYKSDMERSVAQKNEAVQERIKKDNQ